MFGMKGFHVSASGAIHLLIFNTFIFMPRIERSRGILFYRCPSVQSSFHPSVRLSVCLSAQTLGENLTLSHYSQANHLQGSYLV